METELHSSDAFHCSTVLSSNCSLASMTWQSSRLLPLYCVCPPVHCCLRLHSLPCTFRAAPADPPCSQRRRPLSQSAVFAPRWLGFRNAAQHAPVVSDWYASRPGLTCLGHFVSVSLSPVASVFRQLDDTASAVTHLLFAALLFCSCRVCCGAGAAVACNVQLRDIDIHCKRSDARCSKASLPGSCSGACCRLHPRHLTFACRCVAFRSRSIKAHGLGPPIFTTPSCLPNNPVPKPCCIRECGWLSPIPTALHSCLCLLTRPCGTTACARDAPRAKRNRLRLVQGTTTHSSTTLVAGSVPCPKPTASGSEPFARARSPLRRSPRLTGSLHSPPRVSSPCSRPPQLDAVVHLAHDLVCCALRCRRRGTRCISEKRCLSSQIRKIHTKELSTWKSRRCAEFLQVFTYSQRQENTSRVLNHARRGRFCRDAFTPFQRYRPGGNKTRRFTRGATVHDDGTGLSHQHPEVKQSW